MLSAFLEGCEAERDELCQHAPNTETADNYPMLGDINAMKRKKTDLAKSSDHNHVVFSRQFNSHLQRRSDSKSRMSFANYYGIELA